MSKRFTPPRTKNRELGDFAQHVYDAINALAAMVAGEAPKAGKGRTVEGAMRVVKRGGTYYLAVRTAEGEKFLPLPNDKTD